MNTKDLKSDSALGGRINDGSTKYVQSSNNHQNPTIKTYTDIGASSLVKVDVQTSRPCAIIGPDRVLPLQNSSDGYNKKTLAEPWSSSENVYRQPPEYKICEYQPSRNISPRLTFQENMQRIMVSPYSSVKKSDDANFPVDRNVAMLKDVKLNMPLDAKYCEVPYSVNTACNEQKSVRIADMRVPNVNPGIRSAPHGWPHNNVTMRSLRPHGATELYQYPEFPSCTGPRAMPMVRPQRIVHDEAGRMFPEPYYQDPNVRFRPYPPTKGRHLHGRYEYVSNYTNPFPSSPTFPPQPFDSQKAVPSHSYPLYPQAPLKYIDRRTGEPMLETYQRSNPQGNMNVTYHNQIIHPSYGSLQTNCVQGNIFSYPPENSHRGLALNKLPYTNSSKVYADYELLQNKKNQVAETMYTNDISRLQPMKGEAYPNYPPMNIPMNGIHSQHNLYRRENIQLKNIDYIPHLKNFDHPVGFHNQLLRHPLNFSPNSIAISPSDSNTSNDTNQTHSNTHEDCGYVSQSSTASGRSMDLHINGIASDYHLYRSADRYGYLPRNTQLQTSNANKNSKVKKDLNVRQFLQMWNEGDDEVVEQTKEENVLRESNNSTSSQSQSDSINKQEQLYVLGLVNVPSEELGKYDHIQKISKLPENIKGYNNIELLNQFEEVIESSSLRNSNVKAQRPSLPRQAIKTIPRPVSPLDVEAKISQSVIHKEVGCNFEIKPCSPKMLNVEISTPVENILEERIIERVSNPISVQAAMLHKPDKINFENNNFNNSPRCEKLLKEINSITSCNMATTKYANDALDIKESYSLQDLEYNSSLCMASLPRLDNDLELNFPEINQQFLDANKIESLSSAALKELPNLDSDKEKNISVEKVGQCSPSRKTDKEFSKLSKYRKLKKQDKDQKEIPSESDVTFDTVQKIQLRTDSVIIENPDNVKTHEPIPNVPSVNNTNNNDNNRASSYISYDVVRKEEISVIAEILPNQYSDKNETADIESAIDFSLNKNDNELLKDNSKQNSSSLSLLSFIEQNLNMTEPYEDTKFIAVTNDHKSNKANTKRDCLSEDPNENSNMNVLSSKHSIELTTEDRVVAGDVKDMSIPSQSELNSCNDPISTKTQNEFAHQTTQEIKETSYVNSESIIIITDSKNNSESGTEQKIQNNKEHSLSCDNSFGENMPSRLAANHEDDKINSDSCDMKCKESVYIINKNTRDDKLHVENIVNLLPSATENNMFTPAEEKNTKFEHSDKLLDNNNKAGLQICVENKLIHEKRFNKRLYSSIVFNLMITSIENLKDRIESQTKYVFDEETNKNVYDEIFEENKEDLFPKLTDDSEHLIEILNEKLSANESSSEKIAETNYRKADDSSQVCGINSESSKVTDETISVLDVCAPKSMNSSLQKETNNTLNCKECKEKIDTIDLKLDSITQLAASNNNVLEVVQIEDIESKPERNPSDCVSFKELAEEGLSTKQNIRLKRSLSDSALNTFLKDDQKNITVDYHIPKKRKKNNPCEVRDPKFLAEKWCKLIQTNRRNSISTLYSEENVSFCILIDNSCHIIEDTVSSPKITLTDEGGCEAEKNDNCMLTSESVVFTNDPTNKITCSLTEHMDTNSNGEIHATHPIHDSEFTSANIINDHGEDKAVNETWIEDVACIETVFSDEIAEDTTSIDEDFIDPSNLTENQDTMHESEDENEAILSDDINNVNNIKSIYCNEMCKQAGDLVETLYKTPQMDVENTIICEESHYAEQSPRYYDNESLEKILSDSNYKEELTTDTASVKFKTDVACTDLLKSKKKQDDKENEYEEPPQETFIFKPEYSISDHYDNGHKSIDTNNITNELTQYDMIHSCESTCDYTGPYKSPRYSSSSSPEVSSTTSEEKSCGILLKITNCNGSISSQLNEFNSKNTNKLHTKLSQKNEVLNYNGSLSRSRPLLTKAAQKYIPPLKETKPDLKVKLPLPKHSLNKLKILKISKDKPKLDKPMNKNHSSLKVNYPKKSKPKFEDVLKSIDEIQIKMHKEKSKKQKHSIPKVVIKKNENGAHYASTSSDNDAYNPDLTGRKWQPWVFIEKNYFVDKMALSKKVKAVFNYRKNTYVLAEKFRKYKSIHNANFVITQPKLEDISSGKLKYTIRLKHNY